MKEHGRRDKAQEKVLWEEIRSGERKVHAVTIYPYVVVQIEGVVGGIGVSKYNPHDAQNELPWNSLAGYNRALGRAVANAFRGHITEDEWMPACGYSMTMLTWLPLECHESAR